MTPQGKRISMEEKGQRTARSTDPYHTEKASKEVAVCSGCSALYWNKRWYLDEGEAESLISKKVKNTVLCPACQRMQDNNPAGIAVFTGDYLVAHEEEILNSLKNIEEKARVKNPLSRIMEIRQDGNILTVLTSDDKLAQKLGRDIFKAHSGSLQYQWSNEHNFVRVNWSRQH